MRFELAIFMVLTSVVGCIKERCYRDSDCLDGKVCNVAGVCVYMCMNDSDCGNGFECKLHRCVPKTEVRPLSCPPDMVPVAGMFCIDRFEASRPDATSTSSGTMNTVATSRPGVLPWLVQDNAMAEAACEAAKKRLCTPAEWETACRGPKGTVYAYGNEYDSKICNGIETFGPGAFHLMPTGSFPDCTNDYGIFDMNGNVWEHVLGGDSRTVRGGAYNCSDSRTFHRCDYVPRTWTPSALGFRCCLVPDNSTPELVETLVDAEDSGSEGGGCVPVEEVVDVITTEKVVDIVLDETLAEDTVDEIAIETTEETKGPYCPPDMALVPLGPKKAICMDKYEASHADATAESIGVSPVATSRPGVLPWYVSHMSIEVLTEFENGCKASGKRLCTKEEWFEACNGPLNNIYFFGNIWNPETCNSVDSFCDDWCAEHGISSCNTSENCGYQYYCFHVVPTGTFQGCTNEYGLYDVNGNVWEIVPVDTPRGYEVRGGAFNCGSPSLRFRCDFVATWDALYAGFRCCKEPE